MLSFWNGRRSLIFDCQRHEGDGQGMRWLASSQVPPDVCSSRLPWCGAPGILGGCTDAWWHCPLSTRERVSFFHCRAGVHRGPVLAAMAMAWINRTDFDAAIGSIGEVRAIERPGSTRRGGDRIFDWARSQALRDLPGMRLPRALNTSPEFCKQRCIVSRTGCDCILDTFSQLQHESCQLTACLARNCPQLDCRKLGCRTFAVQGHAKR